VCTVAADLFSGLSFALESKAGAQADVFHPLHAPGDSERIHERRKTRPYL
jgi:hypothetical protein